MNRAIRTDREELERQIAELGAVQPWNHNFDLGDGVQTRPGAQTSQGKNLVKFQRLEPLFKHLGLQGKTVLDVGCNEGFFSMQLAREGARVFGVDADQHRIAKAKFIQSILHVTGVEFHLVDIYSNAFTELPRADLCLCLGVLHRVPDPLSAIAALTGKADLIIFEWKVLKFGPHDDAFAYFSAKPVDERDCYGTEYWLLSFAAVERILGRLGFTYFHRRDDPRQRRAVLVAGREHHAIFDEPDVSIHRGRIRALLSHTKRYVRTVAGVLTGRINA